MSTYDYKTGKARVEEILNNRTEVIEQDSIPKDDQYTYENAYNGWVSAIFVDIRDSTTLFQNADKVIVSKVIRCFTSEIIDILNSDPNIREIGIRGDCVYAIYTTPKKIDIYEVAEKTLYVNSYIHALNKLLSNKRFPAINAGIGMSTAKELVVKAGRKGSGINNLVWIGDAVTTASKLSSIANKDNLGSILFSKTSYDNFIGILKSNRPDATTWFTEESWSLYGPYYSADLIIMEFEDWIDAGMQL